MGMSAEEIEEVFKAQAEMHCEIDKHIRNRIKYAGSYERLPILLDVAAELDGEFDEFDWIEPWLRVVGDKWESFDNVSHFQDAVLNRFFAHTFKHELRGFLMTDNEYEFFEQLARSEKIYVFRGCSSVNIRGMSWSLDRGIASEFPFMNRYKAKGDPLLVSMQIDPAEDILAVKLGRNECEIIVDPRKIKDDQLKIEVLSAPISYDDDDEVENG